MSNKSLKFWIILFFPKSVRQTSATVHYLSFWIWAVTITWLSIHDISNIDIKRNAPFYFIFIHRVPGSTTAPKSEKKESASSILPTINIGTSLGQKSTSVGGLGGISTNSTTRQQQQQQQQQQHQQQQQPQLQQREATLARVSLSGVNSAASEEQHRLRMTHADTSGGVRKSRDNPLRGN